MNDEWSDVAALASPGPLHSDPAPDGPPLASPDGHWWWDGRAWVRRLHPNQPAA